MSSPDTGIFQSRLMHNGGMQAGTPYPDKNAFEFVVNRFYDINKPIQRGGEIPDRKQDALVLRDGLSEYKDEPPGDLLAHVEAHREIDFNDWGTALLYNALIAYAFQQGMEGKSKRGIRIYPDISYEFFDLENSGTAFKEEAGNKEIQGVLYEYDADKGTGFIRDEKANKWAFLTDDIICSRLKNNFLPFMQTDPHGTVLKPVTVIFENGGRSGDGQFQKAARICKSFENIEY